MESLEENINNLRKENKRRSLISGSLKMLKLKICLMLTEKLNKIFSE